jgi:hypothetical protein
MASKVNHGCSENAHVAGKSHCPYGQLDGHEKTETRQGCFAVDPIAHWQMPIA